jgi:diaminopimelate decarboxylase
MKGGGARVSLPQFEGDDDEVDETEETKALESAATQSTEEFSEVRRIASKYQGHTPERVILSENTRSTFFSLASRVRDANQSGVPKVKIGYSIKTSPTRYHVQTAREAGFMAECISQGEIQRALSVGLSLGEVILNGPGKYWPTVEAPRTGLAMLFCDSLEEFDKTVAIPGISRTLGFRLRVPGLPSRFGVPVEDPEIFRGLLSRVRKLSSGTDFGIHFHMPGWAIGLRRWSQALGALLGWCHTIQNLAGVEVKRLDLGGGLFPDDLERLNFSEIQKRVHQALPGVQELYFEPGRALTQKGEVVFSRVLDVRHLDGKVRECVADACIAELPLAPAGGRPVYLYRPNRSKSVLSGESNQGRLELLGPGKARVLGRICMEDDLLAGALDLPSDLAEGDLLIFGHAGGYQRSMSYGFGRG